MSTNKAGQTARAAISGNGMFSDIALLGATFAIDHFDLF